MTAPESDRSCRGGTGRLTDCKRQGGRHGLQLALPLVDPLEIARRSRCVGQLQGLAAFYWDRYERERHPRRFEWKGLSLRLAELARSIEAGMAQF